ncbi:MAG TPA: LPS export ABC transporter periplasmic protein LptC [Bacteroidetes bacterium]|nr:LPS export ABC transporter periplasmic protein LptC [Arcobacter sp.]HHH52567.1 LPS export ABC transporter periplasmic protein LptC [Bacteroidota bacterium]
MKYFLIASLFLFISCDKKTDEINKLFYSTNRPMEVAKNIDMIYSDSARILFRMESPILRTLKNDKDKIIEYPQGIKISFLDNNKNANSWLVADRAINKIRQKQFIVRGNVKLFNNKNDKLETSELIWDEKEEILKTNKFVKFTSPDKGDTIYGYGFESNKDFTEFEIKNRLSGKVVEDIIKDIK